MAKTKSVRSAHRSIVFSFHSLSLSHLPILSATQSVAHNRNSPETSYSFSKEARTTNQRNVHITRCIYIYSTCIGCQAVAHRPGLQIQVRLDQLFIEEARGWFNTIKIYFAWYGLGSKDLKFLVAQAQHFVNNMEETPVSHLQPDIYCIYIV